MLTGSSLGWSWPASMALPPNSGATIVSREARVLPGRPIRRWGRIEDDEGAQAIAAVRCWPIKYRRLWNSGSSGLEGPWNSDDQTATDRGRNAPVIALGSAIAGGTNPREEGVPNVCRVLGNGLLTAAGVRIGVWCAPGWCMSASPSRYEYKKSHPCPRAPCFADQAMPGRIGNAGGGQPFGSSSLVKPPMLLVFRFELTTLN